MTPRRNCRGWWRVLERIESSDAIRVETIDAPRFRAAKLLFRKHADHDYSFTDCTSVAVMQELKISEALTTDGRFVEAGFKALLRRK